MSVNYTELQKNFNQYWFALLRIHMPTKKPNPDLLAGMHAENIAFEVFKMCMVESAEEHEGVWLLFCCDIELIWVAQGVVDASSLSGELKMQFSDVFFNILDGQMCTIDSKEKCSCLHELDEFARIR